ncbi:MAG: zinc-binding dehydrogenase [Myxococcota bacterium]
MSEGSLTPAVVTDPKAPGFVRLADRARRAPRADELVVEVGAFSLNRGELRFAANRPPGTAIGWDVGGTVVEAAATGDGPAVGTRVVGFSRAQEGWNKRVCLPVRDVATLEEGISLEVAASLPVAAGTALACLEAAGPLLGRRVFVTGVTGGVGGFAVKLARLGGARVIAQVRRDEQRGTATALGADDVVVTADGSVLEKYGPFDAVIDGIGGRLFQAGVAALTADGVAISYGVTGAPSVELPLGALLGKGRARVRGLNLYAVSDVVPPAVWLSRLVRLVGSGRLAVDELRVSSWRDVGEVAQALLDRSFSGKAVLTVDA